jgi:hypothetical protein
MVSVLHARVPIEHAEKLQAHAQANDRTLAQEVRRMVRMYVQMIDTPTRTPVENGSQPSASIELEPIPEP